MRKYELTNETINHNGRTLHRIKALISFKDVKAGQLGGFVQSEYNLSHKGSCWVYGEAKAMDKSIVEEDAHIHDFSEMCDYSTANGSASMFNDSCAIDYSLISDHSSMYHTSIVGGYSEMHDNSKLLDSGRLCDDSRTFDNSIVGGNVILRESAKVCNDVVLKGNKTLYGALYTNVNDFIEIKHTEGSVVTIMTIDNKIVYNVGKYREISEQEFISRLNSTYPGDAFTLYRDKYLRIMKMAKAYFDLENSIAKSGKA